jgi:RNA polymerase sigma factor (TIGR02999 family)
VDPRPTSEITALLTRWQNGDRTALDALVPLIYGELRLTARRYLRHERSDHTLQSTALVHEAFVRMLGQDLPHLQNRSHFFAIAATLMRQILVDHARAHSAAKRGGNTFKLDLTEALSVPQAKGLDLMALDDALNTLAELDPQQSRIVELRYFTGLSIEDTAEVLGISPATVKRDWATARVWLQREMNPKKQA